MHAFRAMKAGWGFQLNTDVTGNFGGKPGQGLWEEC